VVFGHSGTLSFTKISQGWLRETAKRCLHAGCGREGRTSAGQGRAPSRGRPSAGCRNRCAPAPRAVSIPRRPAAPRGTRSLNRLAFAGAIRADQRRGADPGRSRGPPRAHPHPSPRADPPLAASPRAWARTSPSVSATSPPNPNQANQVGISPPEIMRQICVHLAALSSPQMRTGIELAIDTPRRPQQICTLSFDCLAHDADGLPLLVYDDHKAHRPGRRLPISEHTAALITHPAATGSGPLPPHPRGGVDTAAHRPAQPPRSPGDHRFQPGVCPPELD
jgi:hypothetical protein